MRMWTAWCVLMCFLGARAKITQTSSLLLREDERATLKCSQNDDHLFMAWYLQQAGKGLELLYYSSTSGSETKETNRENVYKAKRYNTSDFHLDILSVKMNDSAIYFCASSLEGTPLNFGAGTRLTVLEKNDEIIPPDVAIFSPSKQEIQEKNKATLVCLASGFYPDHLSLVWKVNGAERTEGVGTDEISTFNGSTYSLTSRLRISAQEWFNPSNRFECTAKYFKNETLESRHKLIYGDSGCNIFKENYQRSATAGKFVYIMLIFKSILYGIFVMGMMLRCKKTY